MPHPEKNTLYALLSCQHQGKHIHSLLFLFLCTDVFENPLFSFPQSWHAKIRNGTQQNGYAQQPCLSGAGARYFYIKQQPNNNETIIYIWMVIYPQDNNLNREREDEPLDLVVAYVQTNPFKNRISSTMCSGRFIWLRHGVWKDDAINPSSNLQNCSCVPAPVMRFS